jgi:DNA-binding protein
MNKYQLVVERKLDEAAKPNEIRVTKNGFLNKHIGNGVRILQGEGEKTLVIRAMGQAIHRAITVAEILKRRVPGLHQLNELSAIPVVDVYEPIEEGLDRVEMKRNVSCISVTLALTVLDVKHSGYQPPIPKELMEHYSAERNRRVQNRSSKRVEGDNEQNFNGYRPRGPRRGRGRGRGRRPDQRNSSRISGSLNEVNRGNQNNNQDSKVTETNQRSQNNQQRYPRNPRNQPPRYHDNQENQRKPGPPRNNNQGTQRNSTGPRNQGINQPRGNGPRGPPRERVNSARPARGTYQSKQNNSSNNNTTAREQNVRN